jgi:hypothetical protein
MSVFSRQVTLIAMLFLFSSTFTGLNAASAATCPPLDVDGKTVANLFMGKSKIEIKRVDYPKSGVLDPQPILGMGSDNY